jgi:hypothetical protein
MSSHSTRIWSCPARPQRRRRAPFVVMAIATIAAVGASAAQACPPFEAAWRSAAKSQAGKSQPTKTKFGSSRRSVTP